MRYHELDKDITAQFDEWKVHEKAANTERKKADRCKDMFVAAFGDRDVARLSDGRIVRRVREARGAYAVPDGMTIRYVVEVSDPAAAA